MNMVGDAIHPAALTPQSAPFALANSDVSAAFLRFRHSFALAPVLPIRRPPSSPMFIQLPHTHKIYS
jgi:hypothetical protein